MSHRNGFNFILQNKISHLVGHGVPDALVELLALHDEVAVPGPDDAALGGDGAGGVDVIPSHHAHLNYTLSLVNWSQLSF